MFKRKPPPEWNSSQQAYQLRIKKKQSTATYITSLLVIAGTIFSMSGGNQMAPEYRRPLEILAISLWTYVMAQAYLPDAQESEVHTLNNQVKVLLGQNNKSHKLHQFSYQRISEQIQKIWTQWSLKHNQQKDQKKKVGLLPPKRLEVKSEQGKDGAMITNATMQQYNDTKLKKKRRLNNTWALSMPRGPSTSVHSLDTWHHTTYTQIQSLLRNAASAPATQPNLSQLPANMVTQDPQFGATPLVTPHSGAPPAPPPRQAPRPPSLRPNVARTRHQS